MKKPWNSVVHTKTIYFFKMHFLFKKKLLFFLLQKKFKNIKCVVFVHTAEFQDFSSIFFIKKNIASFSCFKIKLDIVTGL